MSLFGEAETRDPSRVWCDSLTRSHAQARAIAGALPEGLFLGTSSWSFPGWAGIVYSSKRTQTELAREGLREYAQHPLLTTVGIDRTYYAPLSIEDLAAYHEQLPNGFRCCIKAPSAVTAYTIGPPGARIDRNPDFLSIDRFVEDLLQPLALAFRENTGPIILAFPPFSRGARLGPEEFVDRLDFFLQHLPREFDLAIELRDRTLLTPAYRDVLARHQVGHTYNYWTAMPMPGDQARVVPPEEPPFSIVRLLLKPGTWYEDQREAFRPFDRLQAPDEAMRDDVVTVAGRALKRQKRVFILVNNKAEGSSPLTVVELAKRLSNGGR
jgi:uncharacterized protein YecE (DUF72 family)